MQENAYKDNVYTQECYLKVGPKHYCTSYTNIKWDGIIRTN